MAAVSAAALIGQRSLEQHVVLGDPEHRFVGGQRKRRRRCRPQCAVGIGAGDGGRVPTCQQIVPAGQRSRAAHQAKETVVAVQWIEQRCAEEAGPSGRAPLRVAVQDLDAPVTREAPPCPSEVLAWALRMGREGQAVQIVEVAQGIEAVARKAVGRCRQADRQQMALVVRDLRADDGQDAGVAVALPGLAGETVVVGDDDKVESGSGGGRLDVRDRATAIRMGRMDVGHAGHSDEPVRHGRGGNPQRMPRNDAPHQQCAGEQEDDREPARGCSAGHGCGGVRAGAETGSGVAPAWSSTRSCGGFPRAPRGA